VSVAPLMLRLALLLLAALRPASPAALLGLGTTSGDSASGRVAKVSRGAASSRLGASTTKPTSVVEDSMTEETVKGLNDVSFNHFRTHDLYTDEPPAANPFALVETDIAPLSERVSAQLEAEEPVLTASAQHFFGSGRTREGKRVRPVIVLLTGNATAVGKLTTQDELDASWEKQKALAAITEMIHTASLIHDDVLDAADTRRGGSAVHRMYSNKAAVLSGDFLLARASVALARLQVPQVTQEMAKSLEALVQGEIMQLKSTADERLSLEYYLTKSYCKTASLMAFSCKSAALLSGHSIMSDVAVAMEKYGYHFGLAFQVIDDLLDFTGTADTLGKPGLQDMALGLSTAPVLYAAEDHPELQELIARKFGEAGDVQRACDLVHASDGLPRTKALAMFHAQAAVDACCSLPESEARDGLIRLCHIVLSRSS